MGISAALGAMATTIGPALTGMVAGAVVGAAVGAITSAITGGSLSKGLLYGALGGAVVGGIGGAMMGSSMTTLGGNAAGTTVATSIGASEKAMEGAILSGSTLTGASTVATGGALSSMGSTPFLVGASVLGSLSKSASAKDQMEAQEKLYEKSSRDRESEMRLASELAANQPVSKTDQAMLSQRDKEFNETLMENRRQYDTQLARADADRNTARGTLESMRIDRAGGLPSAGRSIDEQKSLDKRLIDLEEAYA